MKPAVLFKTLTIFSICNLEGLMKPDVLFKTLTKVCFLKKNCFELVFNQI